MWLANTLTLSRIPLAVVFWLTYGDWRWSFALVVLAALSDAADGTVARWEMRRTGHVGPTAGEWLDPAADKLFVILVLGAIQVHDPAPWALIALVAARELVVIPLAAAYRLVAPSRMPHAFKAGLLGKAATISELFAIAALIMRSLSPAPATAAAWLFAAAAAILGVGAVVSYVARSLRAVPAV